MGKFIIVAVTPAGHENFIDKNSCVCLSPAKAKPFDRMKDAKHIIDLIKGDVRAEGLSELRTALDLKTKYRHWMDKGYRFDIREI
jgi:hypothetical protein